MNQEENDIETAEIVEKSSAFTGIVNKGKNEFFYYPEGLSFDGQKVDYFHFKKPTLKKAKAHNVVLSNEMSARNIEALLRASLLRIAKKDGGEFLSCHFKQIIEDLDMDIVTEMTDGCSSFFVRGAE